MPNLVILMLIGLLFVPAAGVPQDIAQQKAVDAEISEFAEETSELEPRRVTKSQPAYTSLDGSLSFTLPPGWSVISDDLYETAAGSQADQPTIILTENGEPDTQENSIRINLRQAPCEEMGCICETVGIHTLNTCSRSLQVHGLLRIVANSLTTN